MKKNEDGRPKGLNADFDGDQINDTLFHFPIMANWRYVVCILLAQSLLVAIIATIVVAWMVDGSFSMVFVQLAALSLLMNKSGLREHRPSDLNVRCVKAFVMIPVGFWALTGFLLETPGIEDPRVLFCTVACGSHSLLALWTVTRPLPSERKRKDK